MGALGTVQVVLDGGVGGFRLRGLGDGGEGLRAVLVNLRLEGVGAGTLVAEVIFGARQLGGGAFVVRADVL